LPIVENQREDRANWNKLIDTLFRLEAEFDLVKNQGSRILVPAELAVKVYHRFRTYLNNPSIELYIQVLPKPLFMVPVSERKRAP